MATTQSLPGLARITLLGGSQDIVQTFEDTPGQNRRVSPNDEARSLKLLNVRVGAIITVFDEAFKF